jgi:S1-C subfamily serine protease
LAWRLLVAPPAAAQAPDFTALVREAAGAVVNLSGSVRPVLPDLPLGDDEEAEYPAKLRPGEWVAAIGSPFGFDRSVTAGIVSAVGRTLPEESFVPFIQTDVA